MSVSLPSPSRAQWVLYHDFITNLVLGRVLERFFDELFCTETSISSCFNRFDSMRIPFADGRPRSGHVLVVISCSAVAKLRGAHRLKSRYDKRNWGCACHRGSLFTIDWL